MVTVIGDGVQSRLEFLLPLYIASDCPVFEVSHSLFFAPPVPQRVKVYRLNDDGKWDDKGTGHVSVEYLEVRAHLLYIQALSWVQDRSLWRKLCRHRGGDMLGADPGV